MGKFDTHSLLNAGQKINPVIRVLAILLSALFLAALSHQVFTLLFETRTIMSALAKILSLLLATYLLRPFLYAAIKGKSPKLWHVRQ